MTLDFQLLIKAFKQIFFFESRKVVVALLKHGFSQLKTTRRRCRRIGQSAFGREVINSGSRGIDKGYAVVESMVGCGITVCGRQHIAREHEIIVLYAELSEQ